MSATRKESVRAGDECTRALLSRYREGFYNSCSTYGASLLDVTDALLTQPSRVCCPAHLSLEASVGHGAFYKALSRGTIDSTVLRRANLSLMKDLGLDTVFTVDCTAVSRPDAKTSPQRTMQHLGDQHRGQPGWGYQVICAQTHGHNSWNLPIEARRVGIGPSKEQVAFESMRAICQEVGQHCTFVFDSGYSSAQLTHLTREAGLDVTVIVRLANYQVMYERPAVKAPGIRGGPRSYGARFELKTDGARRATDTSFTWTDSAYGEVAVSVYGGLRQKITRSTHPWIGQRYIDDQFVPVPKTWGSVLEVTVAKLPGKPHGGKLWLWSSDPLTTVEQVRATVRAYFHRFDIEHMFRFMKQSLGLTGFSCQQPGTFDTWFNLVLVAFNQLLAARGIVEDQRLPWEKKCQTLTPGRVRRVIKTSLNLSWHPPPRLFIPSGGPGAAKGSGKRPREKHPVTLKG